MGVTKKRRDTVFTHAHRKHIHIHAHVDTRRKLTGKPWIKEASRTVSSLPYYCNASIFFFSFFFPSFFSLAFLARIVSSLAFLLHSRFLIAFFCCIFRNEWHRDDGHREPFSEISIFLPSPSRIILFRETNEKSEL